MKKHRKLLAIVLAVCLCMVGVLAGCTEAPASETPASEAPASEAPASEAPASEAPASEAPASEAPASEAPASEAPAVHEIYTKTGATSLSGVVGPNIEDRNFDKAWPKTPKDPNKITIGWTEITLGNDWFVEMAKAAQKKAEEYGFQLDMLVADGSVEKQNEHIESFITKDYDVIVVDPCDVLGPVEAIKRAVAAGIPVVGMGTVMDASAPVLTHVCLNPFAVGYSCGEYLGTKFDANEQLNLAIILGVMGNSTSESRICGGMSGIIASRQQQLGTFTSKEDAMLIAYNLFEDVRNTGRCESTDLKLAVLGFGDGNWTEEDGLAAAEDIITANADNLDLIICCNDFEAKGAYKAVSDRGLTDKIKVAAFADGTKVGMEMVKSGELLCTGTFGGPAFGAGTIDFIKMIFQDGKDPSNLPIATYDAVEVISPDNLDKYLNADDPDSLFYPIPEFTFPKTIDEIRASF